MKRFLVPKQMRGSSTRLLAAASWLRRIAYFPMVQRSIAVVRNLSETGAALAVETPVGIPPRFSLLVDSDGIKRASRIVWRNQLRIGVKFDDGDGRS